MATNDFEKFVKDVYDITGDQEEFVSLAVLGERETGKMVLLHNVDDICILDMEEMLKIFCKFFLMRASFRRTDKDAERMLSQMCDEVISTWKTERTNRLHDAVTGENSDDPITYQNQLEEKRFTKEFVTEADLTRIYLTKYDYELVKRHMRIKHENKGLSKDEALRAAINIWADGALSRLNLNENTTKEEIIHELDLRRDLRKMQDEKEKDVHVKIHLEPPLFDDNIPEDF